MGINVAWVNERHETKKGFSESAEAISDLASSRWPRLTESVCLRFIEPWGDTTFNQSQIPVLLDELRAEIRNLKDERSRGHLERLVTFVELAENQIHTYIKFIGD